PFLSIEITKECPLRCPGCYAYGQDHLTGGGLLRQVTDYKGKALIDRVLRLVDHYRPLHGSIVGGEPLLPFPEPNHNLPQLADRNIHIQLVTSAVRRIPREWAKTRRLTIAVSIDGLPAEHDVRRRPATYDRILQNIRGHRITIHCTVTRQMTDRAGYLRQFLEFWTPREEVEKVWISLFTPQIGERSCEVLPPDARQRVVEDLLELRHSYTTLAMPEAVIRAYRKPPANPAECIFTTTTRTITADLKTRITPCQFGGNPDCSQCGCIASGGLAAVGRYRFTGG